MILKCRGVVSRAEVGRMEDRKSKIAGRGSAGVGEGVIKKKEEKKK